MFILAQFMSHFLGYNVLTPTIQIMHDIQENSFAQSYLLSYYPRAALIRELFFPAMTPSQLDKALADIVDLFAERAWLYFADDESKIKLYEYWEHVIDQCSLLNEFLKKARVDRLTERIFLARPLRLNHSINTDYSIYQAFYAKNHLMQGSVLLFTYFKEHRLQAIYDFYALSFDYVIKLFNENILLKNQIEAQRFFEELEFIFGRLRGSSYEVYYQEAINTCKELLAILDAKCTDLDEDEDLPDVENEEGWA